MSAFNPGKPDTKNEQIINQLKKNIFFQISSKNTRNLVFILYLPKVFFKYLIL